MCYCSIHYVLIANENTLRLSQNCPRPWGFFASVSQCPTGIESLHLQCKFRNAMCKFRDSPSTIAEAQAAT